MDFGFHTGDGHYGHNSSYVDNSGHTHTGVTAYQHGAAHNAYIPGAYGQETGHSYDQSAHHVGTYDHGHASAYGVPGPYDQGTGSGFLPGHYVAPSKIGHSGAEHQAVRFGHSQDTTVGGQPGCITDSGRVFIKADPTHPEKEVSPTLKNT